MLVLSAVATGLLADAQANVRDDGTFQYSRMIPLASSATPYVEAIRCVDKAMGGTLASATRTFASPYTRRLASTTPPWSWGSMAHDEEGWNSVVASLRTQSAQSSSLFTADPGDFSFVKQLFNGPVSPNWRAIFSPSRRISKSIQKVSPGKLEAGSGGKDSYRMGGRDSSGR